MAKKQNVHVVPNGNKWDVKIEGNSKPSKTFPTKPPAVKYAKERAKELKSEMIPHLKNGKISNPNSYGKDSNPPKDKKK